MIGALQKILSKTTEPDTKNGVEEYILLTIFNLLKYLIRYNFIEINFSNRGCFVFQINKRA